MMPDMMDLSKCTERFVPIFNRFIFLFTSSMVMSQSTADSLYAELESKGGWKNYYVANEKSGFDFVTIDGSVDSIFFAGDNTIEP